MATPWERVRAMKGQTLPTVTGRAVFDVEAADNDSIQVVPYSSGKPRTISSHEFDRAEILGLAVPSVTPIQLRTAGASEFNPAHVAAIIRAVSEQMPTA